MVFEYLIDFYFPRFVVVAAAPCDKNDIRLHYGLTNACIVLRADMFVLAREIVCLNKCKLIYNNQFVHIRKLRNVFKEY